MSHSYKNVPQSSSSKSGELFEALLKAAKASPNGKIIPRRVTDLVPLSVAQERLWFLEQLEPGNPTYNITRVFRLTGRLEGVVLEQSLNEIVSRHEILRTSFTTVDGQPVAVLNPMPTVSHRRKKLLPLSVRDLSYLPDADRIAQMQQFITEESRQPFDLTKGPLIRVTLLRLREEEHVLCLVMHHMVSDGWSITIFFRELAALYQAFLAGKPSPLPALPIQYGDYAIWQREWLQSEALNEQLAYWTKQLEGIPAGLELPTDYPRLPVKSFQGAYKLRVLPRDLTRSLKAFSQQEGVTLFMLLLAAFKVLLFRYTGQQEIVIGTPIANRNRTQIDKLIGVFVNSLVLRTSLSDSLTFRELLAQVRQVALDAYTHQDLPFEKLLEELQPHRDLSHTPLFQIFFNMQNFEGDQLELADLATERILPPEPDSKFDITLYVVESGEEIQLQLVYNTDLFCRERMVELLAQFEILLSQVITEPDGKITHFSLLTPRAKQLLPDPGQVLHSNWKGAIHTQFSWQARVAPERIAVRDKQEILTYQELNARSNQLAHYLITNGVQPQEVVAIYGYRGAALIWAVLGVLKAGAAFLILDPAYPASRLSDYLCLAQPRAWLQLEAAGPLPETLTDCLNRLPCRCRLLLPQQTTPYPYDLLGEYSTKDPEISIEPDDLACISFTSGSTGQPKGILGRHGSLTHFLPWQVAKFNLSAEDRFSMLSGLSHDPLQRDIFTPFWIGATLCIPDPDLLGMAGRLADWMAQEKITSTNLTPAMAQILTETISSNASLPLLRYAFFVGEILTRQDVARLRRLAPRVTCINYYGTTETQRALSYYVVPLDPETKRLKAVYPLGKGMPNAQLLVLNTEQQLAGIGELGEICIRSPHLAQGYLKDETLTQVRFLTTPFTGIPEDRLYRTGDLGRYLPDGNVEFAGRNDQQVKVRGFRIELGEIEARLAQHPAVWEAVVLAHSNSAGETKLAAYVVPDHQPTPTVSDLHTYLKQSLPSYMIPANFVFLDSLPLTPNGKVDYQALPTPDQTYPDLASGFLAPRNTLELQLVKIWEQILGVQPVGVQDNFFELGGHSLLAVRMVAQVEKTTGKKLSLVILFQAPTVEQLANILQQKEQVKSTTSLITIQAGERKPPFFCIPGNLGNVFSDLGHLAQHLDLAQPFYGFQDGPHNPARVEALAAHYVEEIRQVHPEGPYLLAGICSGGTVAFEMAQQLRAAGQEVPLLALVEPSYPRIASLRTYADFGRSILRRFIKRFGYQSRTMTALDKTEWKTYLGLKWKMIANLWAINRYIPRPYSGRIDLFLTPESLEAADHPRFDWRNFTTAKAFIHELPGTHNTITGTDDTEIEESVMQELAEQLTVCIDEVLGNNGGS